MASLIRARTPLVSFSRRGFLGQLGMKNVTEADVNTRINEQQRTYNHDRTLVFDNLGRYLIYDGVPMALSQKAGPINTLLTMGSFYWAYQAYYTLPFLASSMYLPGAAAGLMFLSNLARFVNARGSYVRIYLLQNRSVLRFQDGKGLYHDLPISGVSLTKYSAASQQLIMNVNSKNKILALRASPFFDPVLLYAITHPMVSQIEGEVANQTV